ncbi:S26 family signal peptidase [Streptomyces echinatus]|uniref:S26 family signal peptidase n=1 Tax=Streptomyces echinatus TaxID=67293 RepID=UPI0037B81C04
MKRKSWISILLGAGGFSLLSTAWALGKRSGPPLFVVDVQGHSMEPLYHAGDQVLATGFVGRRGIRRGAIVIVRSPETDEGLFIKEVVAVAGDPVPELFRRHAGTEGDLSVPAGCMLVLGRHPASKDSKQWGYLPEANVEGRVVLRTRTGLPGGTARP